MRTESSNSKHFHEYMFALVAGSIALGAKPRHRRGRQVISCVECVGFQKWRIILNRSSIFRADKAAK